jgi:amidase
LHEQAEWIAQSTQSWHAADRERQDLRAAYERFFARYDVLVCPVCASVAWTKDEGGAGDHEWLRRPVLGGDRCAQHFWRVGRRVIAGAAGHATPYHRQVFWSGVTNVGGHPATAFPAGRADSVEGAGMPVGLQAVGAEWHDLTTIRFAEALETELGYAFLPPAGY